jgi:hypothetical protein
MSQVLWDWGSWLSLTRTRLYISDIRHVDIRHVEVRIAGEGARHSNLRRLCENCITSGSPLCRSLTRATYILCIEHLRLMRLSRKSNPGTQYAKSHSNGIVNSYSKLRLVLLQYTKHIRFFHRSDLIKQFITSWICISTTGVTNIALLSLYDCAIANKNCLYHFSLHIKYRSQNTDYSIVPINTV